MLLFGRLVHASPFVHPEEDVPEEILGQLERHLAEQADHR